MRKVLARIRKHGAITLRDIDDDVLVDKDHAWASRKPSERALRLAFYGVRDSRSANALGILKTYELTNKRHFGWDRSPKTEAPERETLDHLLDRALRSQGVVSLDSTCHLDAPRKPGMRRLIESRVRRKELIPVEIEGAGKQLHWARPETLDAALGPIGDVIHILSPFDPLIIQRKRAQAFLWLRTSLRSLCAQAQTQIRYGYFALPALIGDKIVAVMIDLKTDRAQQKLLIQQCRTWLAKVRFSARTRIVLRSRCTASSGFSLGSDFLPGTAGFQPAIVQPHR